MIPKLITPRMNKRERMAIYAEWERNEKLYNIFEFLGRNGNGFKPASETLNDEQKAILKDEGIEIDRHYGWGLRNKMIEILGASLRTRRINK